jgi:hypothetical protein
MDDRVIFLKRLETVLKPDRRYYLPANVKAPSNINFAVNVLKMYVNSLDRGKDM